MIQPKSGSFPADADAGIDGPGRGFQGHLTGTVHNSNEVRLFKENPVSVSEGNDLFVFFRGNVDIFIERQDFLNVGKRNDLSVIAIERSPDNKLQRLKPAQITCQQAEEVVNASHVRVIKRKINVVVKGPVDPPSVFGHQQFCRCSQQVTLLRKMNPGQGCLLIRTAFPKGKYIKHCIVCQRN